MPWQGEQMIRKFQRPVSAACGSDANGLLVWARQSVPKRRTIINRDIERRHLLSLGVLTITCFVNFIILHGLVREVLAESRLSDAPVGWLGSEQHRLGQSHVACPAGPDNSRANSTGQLTC